MADNSNAVKSKAKAAKRGKPFKKGSDPRRNQKGQISKKRLEFNRNLRELLVAEGEKESTGQIGDKTFRMKNVEWLVKSVWKKAIKGESWAVTFIAERVEGRIMQPVDLKGQIDGKLTIEVIETK